MYPDLMIDSDGSESTKDQIINVLSFDWPLSVRNLYSVLKQRYSTKVTYQAVYKAIGQMVSEGILTRAKDGYALDLKWVKRIHDQTEIMRVNYFSEQHAAILDRKSKSSDAIRVFIFRTWFDVEKYLYYLQKNHVLKSKEKQIICVHHRHEWRPLFYLRAEYNWSRQLSGLGHKTFVLCSGDSAADRWSAKFYNRMGGHVKLGANSAEPAEVMVFSDLVVQVYIPSNFSTALDREFRKAKALKDIDFLALIRDVFEKETEIKVVINKDKALADQIRKQTLAKF